MTDWENAHEALESLFQGEMSSNILTGLQDLRLRTEVAILFLFGTTSCLQTRSRLNLSGQGYQSLPFVSAG